MTDTKTLEAIIERKGLKKKYLADQLGLSAYGLALKIKGRNEFKSGEIVKLSRLLGVATPEKVCSIFFSHELD